MIKRLNVVNCYRYILFLLFKPRLHLSDEDLDPYTKHLRIETVFEDYEGVGLPTPIKESFNSIKDVTEYEYILEVNCNCFVEPQYGWLIRDKRTIIKRSLPYSIAESTPLPHYIYYKRKKKPDFEQGIPLFYNWFNYWHFYNDIIGTLMILDRFNFDKTIPIISPAKALEVSYVKDFFTTEYSKKWNWSFVDEKTYVQLQKAYIIKSFANVKEQFLLAAKIFKTPVRKGGNRKIFLNRGRNKGRNIINLSEILPVIKDYGFEIYDTVGMSVWEQKELFESSSVILGIHGAGLTNMFYRFPEPCTILELFPKDKYPINYYWLAMELGFKYDAISGETNENGSFLLDKNKLIELLNRN